LLFIILTSTSAFSEENPEQVDDTDTTTQYVAAKWNQINRNVDMFFTNKKTKASENKSSVFVYASYYKKEGQPAEPDYDFQLKFDLPNTTKKLKIVIERQQDEISNVLSDSSAPETKTLSKKNGSKTSRNTRKNADSSYTAGANIILKQSKYFISFLRFGIRIDLPLNPSIKLDVRKDYKNKIVNVALAQKILFYRQEGLQNISQFILNKKLSKNFQTDLVNSLVWSDETDIFVLRNNIILYQDLGDEKGLSYSIGANAKFSPTFYYDSYDTSVSYRQLLYSDWLYGTVTLGADFPKEARFNDQKFAQVRFDIFFKE
jgi:hypothetical protein